MGKIRDGFPGAKEAANIDPMFLHGTEADVAMGSQVHFQILAQRDSKGVGLETDPPPSFFPNRGLAAGGGDPSFFPGRRLAGLGMKTAPRRRELPCEDFIQPMAGKAEGRAGQGPVWQGMFAPENFQPRRGARPVVGQGFLIEQGQE
jgi:hypothetical protein